MNQRIDERGQVIITEVYAGVHLRTKHGELVVVQNKDNFDLMLRPEGAAKTEWVANFGVGSIRSRQEDKHAAIDGDRAEPYVTPLYVLIDTSGSMWVHAEAIVKVLAELPIALVDEVTVLSSDSDNPLRPLYSKLKNAPWDPVESFHSNGQNLGCWSGEGLTRGIEKLASDVGRLKLTVITDKGGADILDSIKVTLHQTLYLIVVGEK